jgi:hypothetical protein
MTAVEVPAGVLTALVVSVLPLGAGFLAWVVRELYRTTDINARTAARLEHLEGRVERIEAAVWAPAWSGPPTTSSSNARIIPPAPEVEC